MSRTGPSAEPYEGRRVIASGGGGGGGGAGAGAAVARPLEPLGAEIHAIDPKERPIPAPGFHSLDLMDPEAMAGAAEEIDGAIYGLFSCAGLPGGRFSHPDTMPVDSVGRRPTPDEQATRLVFLNSPGASAITGEAIMTDGGTSAALSVGTLDVSAFGF